MQMTHIRYKSTAMLVFSLEEIDVMLDCSAHHYDGLCKDASRPPSGWLYRLRQQEVVEPGLAHELDWRQIDTLAKIVEVAPHLRDVKKNELGLGLSISLRRVLVSMNEHAVDALAITL